MYSFSLLKIQKHIHRNDILEWSHPPYAAWRTYTVDQQCINRRFLTYVYVTHWLLTIYNNYVCTRRTFGSRMIPRMVFNIVLTRFSRNLLCIFDRTSGLLQTRNLNRAKNEFQIVCTSKWTNSFGLCSDCLMVFDVNKLISSKNNLFLNRITRKEIFMKIIWNPCRKRTKMP